MVSKARRSRLANLKKGAEALRLKRALGLLGRGGARGRLIDRENRARARDECRQDREKDKTEQDGDAGAVKMGEEEIKVEVKEETEDDDQVNIEYHFVEDYQEYSLGRDKKAVEDSAYHPGPFKSSLVKEPVAGSFRTSTSSKQQSEQRIWSKGRPSILKKRFVKPPVLPSPLLNVGGTNQIQVCRCLLCFQEITNDKPKIVQRNADTVESNYRSMFILKKMLSVPNDTLSELLQQKYGQSPSEWITVCGTCTPVVNEALMIQKEINRLEVNLRKCQEGMISKIQATWEEKEGTNQDDLLQPTLETRRMVVKRTLTVSGSSSNGNPTKKVALVENESSSMVEQGPPDIREEGSSCAEQEYIEEDDDDEEYPWEDEAPMPQVQLTNSQIGSGGKSKKYNIPKQRSPINPGEFGCYLCPALEKMSLDDLVHHIKFHNRKPLKCTKCNLFFSSEAEANIVVQNKDNQSSTCGSTSSSSKICSTHSLTTVKYEAGNTSIWKCDHCTGKFATETERDLHEDTAHDSPAGDQSKNKKKYKCNWCWKPTSFRNWEEWQLHRALEHPKAAAFCCPYCDQIFKLQTKEGVDLCDTPNMKGHVTKFHKSDRLFPSGIPPSPDECHLCGELFWDTQKKTLHRHMERVHGLSKIDSYSCPVCHLRTEKKNEAFSHLYNAHHHDQICTTQTLEKRSLNKHSRKKGQEFFCESCGFKTQNLVIFEDHKFLKHGDLPESRPVLKCSKEECTFQCVNRKRMEQHMMKEHGAERRHKCHVCGKGFLNAKHLREHEEIHKNAELKPYQCDICGNSFAVRNYLYIHMRLSHQNRPFASTHKKKSSRKTKSTVPKPSNNEANIGGLLLVPAPPAVTADLIESNYCTNTNQNQMQFPPEFEQAFNFPVPNNQFNQEPMPMEPQLINNGHHISSNAEVASSNHFSFTNL